MWLDYSVILPTYIQGIIEDYNENDFLKSSRLKNDAIFKRKTFDFVKEGAYVYVDIIKKLR